MFKHKYYKYKLKYIGLKYEGQINLSSTILNYEKKFDKRDEAS